MNVSIKPTEASQVCRLIEQVRGVDYINLEGTPLLQCIRASATVWVGEVDDELACVFGVMPPSILSERAYLWLHTTDLVDQHKFLFIRRSQIVVEAILEEWPILVGVALIGNTQAIKWLKWLGATFGEPYENRIPFTIRRRRG